MKLRKITRSYFAYLLSYLLIVALFFPELSACSSDPRKIYMIFDKPTLDMVPVRAQVNGLPLNWKKNEAAEVLKAVDRGEELLDQGVKLWKGNLVSEDGNLDLFSDSNEYFGYGNAIPSLAILGDLLESAAAFRGILSIRESGIAGVIALLLSPGGAVISSTTIGSKRLKFLMDSGVDTHAANYSDGYQAMLESDTIIVDFLRCTPSAGDVLCSEEYATTQTSALGEVASAGGQRCQPNVVVAARLFNHIGISR